MGATEPGRDGRGSANSRKKTRAAGVLISVLVLGGVGGSYGRETFQATRVVEPPVVDGRLTDAGWQSARAITGFRQRGKEDKAQYQSVAYALYDDNHLYVGVRCLEPNPERLKSALSEDVGDLFDEDSVEIMVKPHSGRSRYFHYVVSASGAVYDALRTHRGSGIHADWNGDLSAAAASGAGYWSAELRIPFYALELSPRVSPTWELNVCRNKKSPPEMSAIADEGRYHEPWKFAFLSGLDADLARYHVEVGPPQLDADLTAGSLSASASVMLTNSTGRNRRLRIEFLPDPMPGAARQADALSLGAGQSVSLDVGPASLKAPVAGHNNVYGLLQPPTTRRLRVIDADTGQQLSLTNLRYPNELKVLSLRLAEPDGEAEALEAGRRPLTVELTTSVTEAERKRAELLLTIVPDTSERVITHSVTGPARLTRLTLDRSALPLGKLVVEAALRGPDGGPAAETTRGFVNLPERDKVGRVLNNLVTELINLKGEDLNSTQFEFTHPHNGWIFFSSEAKLRSGTADRVAISVGRENEAALILHEEGQPATLEAMRWLPVGNHVLTVRAEGEARLEGLIVRAIPELAFFRFPAGTHLPQQVPRFEWDALQEHILHSVNMISGTFRLTRDPLKSASLRYIEQWREAGKRWLIPGKVPAYTLGPDMTAEQAYRSWADYPAYTDPTWDGIIVDEFAIGDFPVEQYAVMTRAVRQLTKDFPEKRFYPFVLDMYGVQEVEPFFQAVIDNGSPFVWEWYEREEPDEKSATEKLESTLAKGMQEWRDFVLEAPRHAIICLGYYSAPPNSLNENPAVDFKVWMDMQFHLVATHPAFQGLYGLMEYNSKYTDEETLRWQARLYRHYGIEGSTELLSRQYGFRYSLTHLQNPDFDRGTAGWTVAAAEKGSVGSGSFKGLGRLQGRVRGSTRGDNFLFMRRSPKGPNRVTQEIRDLEPGLLYSVKMFTADHQDLISGRTFKQKHAVDIRIEHADMIPDTGFQEVFQSERGQEAPPFSRTRQPWLNYYWLLFRARTPTARLTISDWAGPDHPGGPLGQELAYNFIEVQPYFAAE